MGHAGAVDLHPVERRSASGAAFDLLFGELVAGRLEPGDTLPAERSLTETLKVNRQAVREALQRLAQAGLVDIRQGDSTRVLDFRRSASLDLLPHLLSRPDGSPDPAVARSIMEMRASLGPDVGRLAARRATTEVKDRLASVVSEMASNAADLERLSSLDLEFWDALIEGADNIAYRLAFNSLRQTYEPLQETLRPVLADELTDIETHREIERAVADGNEQGAADLVSRLLAKGSATMAEALVAIENQREEEP
jgi:DNA-binding FadR family transcriptional regulator